jgi:nicotinate-nucleotide pyrophosphorylase (carboxylating)
VECRTLDEVREALNLGVDRILLDNMDLPSIVEAVKVTGGRTPLEVSGNVTLSNVRPYAETGIQFVSVGSLTHSARAMDISLTIHQVRA